MGFFQCPCFVRGTTSRPSVSVFYQCSIRGYFSLPGFTFCAAHKETDCRLVVRKKIREIRDRIIGLGSPPEYEHPPSRCFFFASVVFVSFVSFVVSSRRFRPGKANTQPPAAQLRLVGHTRLWS